MAECGGVARRRTLLRMGVAERALQRAVAQSRIERLGRGVFAAPSADPTLVAATTFNASIGCVTACRHWGLPTWERHTTPHLVVPRDRSQGRRRPSELAKVVIHRSTKVAGGHDGELAHGGPWVPLDQALDQAAWCTSPLGQLVMIDAALHSGALLARDVQQFREGDRTRRSWLVRSASGLAESPPETLARVVLAAAGFAVREQVIINGVGRVDLLVEDSLVVEIDGWLYHSGRDSFEADRARDRELLLRQTPVMRFTAKQVRDSPLGLVAQVGRAVGRTPRADLGKRLEWALRTPRGSRV